MIGVGEQLHSEYPITMTDGYFGAYQFQQWLPRLTQTQAIRWLQTHVDSDQLYQMRLSGRIARVRGRHTLTQLREMIRQQWVELTLVLYDRTLSLMVRPHHTFGKVKQMVIQHGHSPLTPRSPDEFVIQNFGDSFDWEHPESVVYRDDETIGEYYQSVPADYYLWCRRVISPREQRAMVRDRVRDFQNRISEIQMAAEAATGVEPIEGYPHYPDRNAEQLVEEWRRECYRPPDPPTIVQVVSHSDDGSLSDYSDSASDSLSSTE